MEQTVLLGDDAVALGAIHAGITAAYAYPGTPSTEIMEALLSYAEKNQKPIAHWCANEKTAYEAALGVSVVGRRSLVSMKHVGLNVAADPFMSSALVNIHGGLVIAVADDPGMHSSQNEQDSRFYANFARIICLEPSTHQETYDMMREAFELSERYHMPVLLRLVTRLAHSRGMVKLTKPREENPLSKSASSNQWILLPSNAKRQWAERICLQPQLRGYSESSPFNRLRINEHYRDFAVITTGMAGNYYLECKPEIIATTKSEPSHLHIGTYPLAEDKIRTLLGLVKRVLILEEGYPFLERTLRGILPQAIEIQGRESGHIPPDGELNPDLVRKALGLTIQSGVLAPEYKVPARPPQLCPGCPHIDSYGALKEVLSSFNVHLVTSDIGCYTLGAMPEYSAIETCVCMGASIGMARGASEAGLQPSIAVLGDSTFLHSGIQPLLDAISVNANMTVLILDNQTVGMTGGQTTIAPSSNLKNIVLGLGVHPEHVHVIEAHRRCHEQNKVLLQKEIEYPGLSVVIAVRECIETAKRKKSL